MEMATVTHTQQKYSAFVLGSILLTTITIGTSARTRRRFGGHGARRELELG